MPQRFNLFSYERHGDTLIVMPAVNLSEFDFAIIDREVESLLEFIHESRVTNVVVDFQRTNYFGSTALKALVKIGDLVRDKQGAMALCNLSPEEHRILEVAHLGSLWTTAESRDQALKAVEPVQQT